jgi:hypothetical protein
VYQCPSLRLTVSQRSQCSVSKLTRRIYTKSITAIGKDLSPCRVDNRLREPFFAAYFADEFLSDLLDRPEGRFPGMRDIYKYKA